MSRINELVKTLKEASEAYYVRDNIFITDAEFDRLKEELESLDPDNDFLTQVGSPVTSSPLQKVKLTMPMGSLKKIPWDTGPKDFGTWIGSVNKAIGSGRKLVVQHKLDGSSIELSYKRGKLVRACTRGSGDIGEDVTHNLKNAQGVVKDVGIDMDFFIRGESVLGIKIWEDRFSGTKNPRNAAAGVVRRKSNTSSSKYLTFVAFDIVIEEDSNDLFADNATDWKTVEEQINWLKAAGFIPAETIPCRENDVEEIVRSIQSKRNSLEFEIDGAVIKVNKLELQEQMGEHRGYPYWARAWKFESSAGSSVIESVSWGVGTRGTIDPVAHISPCEVAGVTISNVTLHNMDEISRLGVCIGDKVEVRRAGDVIPKITQRLVKGENRKKIYCSVCPSCGYPTKRDGPVLRCTNMDECKGVQGKRIAKWISKRGIMFLGESSLDKLISKGTVSCVFDLYMLTMEKMAKDGIGEGMSRKILVEIEKSMNCSLADLLGSLSIDLLGRSQAQNIIDQGVGTLSQWENISVSDLSNLDGFGSGSKASRISLGVKKNWSTIKQLANILDIQEGSCQQQNGKGKSTNGILGGKSFCFTGAMSMKRNKIEALCYQHGGNVHSKVRKGLDYLVIADPNSTSSKANNARKYGIKMIAETEFMEMV